MPVEKRTQASQTSPEFFICLNCYYHTQYGLKMGLRARRGTPPFITIDINGLFLPQRIPSAQENTSFKPRNLHSALATSMMEESALRQTHGRWMKETTLPLIHRPLVASPIERVLVPIIKPSNFPFFLFLKLSKTIAVDI